MIKTTTLTLALGFLVISASAQKVQEASVPPFILSSFNKMHPNAKVDKWGKEGNNYEAEFKENGIETSVELGPNGQLIATEVEINVSDLPKAVADYFAATMPGKKIAEASKITSATGTVSYEAEVDKVDYHFDSNGTFVKKEVETNDDKNDDKK